MYNSRYYVYVHYIHTSCMMMMITRRQNRRGWLLLRRFAYFTFIAAEKQESSPPLTFLRIELFLRWEFIFHYKLVLYFVLLLMHACMCVFTNVSSKLNEIHGNILLERKSRRWIARNWKQARSKYGKTIAQSC